MGTMKGPYHGRFQCLHTEVYIAQTTSKLVSMTVLHTNIHIPVTMAVESSILWVLKSRCWIN